jgi:hypothetical protein
MLRASMSSSSEQKVPKSSRRYSMRRLSTRRKRLPRVLTEAKSYAGGLFAFERIEHLSEDLARKALTEPAAIEGVAWDDDAITFVVQETSGYPYFLQQFGLDTWNDAPGPGITVADAQVGAARGRMHYEE